MLSRSTLKLETLLPLVLAGDAQSTAEAIAERVGFYEVERHQSLSGAEIDNMSDGELAAKIEQVRVFYRAR